MYVYIYMYICIYIYRVKKEKAGATHRYKAICRINMDMDKKNRLACQYSAITNTIVSST